jgi:hypothetical protein
LTGIKEMKIAADERRGGFREDRKCTGRPSGFCGVGGKRFMLGYAESRRPGAHRGVQVYRNVRN